MASRTALSSDHGGQHELVVCVLVSLREIPQVLEGLYPFGSSFFRGESVWRKYRV